MMAMVTMVMMKEDDDYDDDDGCVGGNDEDDDLDVDEYGEYNGGEHLEDSECYDTYDVCDDQ